MLHMRGESLLIRFCIRGTGGNPTPIDFAILFPREAIKVDIGRLADSFANGCKSLRASPLTFLPTLKPSFLSSLSTSLFPLFLDCVLSLSIGFGVDENAAFAIIEAGTTKSTTHCS